MDRLSELAQRLSAVARILIRAALVIGFLWFALKGAWYLIFKDADAWGWLIVLACVALARLAYVAYRPDANR